MSAVEPQLPVAKIPRDPAAGQVFTYRLVRIVNRLNRHAAAFAAEHAGLSLPEWRCLFLMAPQSSLYVQELLELMSESKGLVSRALSALEAKGLVTLRRDANDRRQMIASCTAKGRKLHERVKPKMEQRERWLLAQVSKTDRAAVLRAIDAVNDALDHWEDAPKTLATK